MTLKRNLLLAVLSVLVAGLVVVACQPAQTPGGQSPAPSAAGESATPQPPAAGEAEAGPEHPQKHPRGQRQPVRKRPRPRRPAT